MLRNMGPNLNFFAMDFDSKGAKIADWVLSAASLAYAGWLFYSGDRFWGWIGLGLGLLGCAVSWWRPLPRLQSYLRGRFVKKRA